MISMLCADEATVMLVVDVSSVFHRHTAAPSDATLPRDERPGCRSAGTEPRARRCHGHGGLQGLYEALELRDGGSDYLSEFYISVNNEFPGYSLKSGSTAVSTTKVLTAAASGVSWWLRDSTARLIYALAGHYFEFIYVLVTP